MGVVSARPDARDTCQWNCRELHPNAIQRSDVEETIEPQALLTRIKAHLDAVDGAKPDSVEELLVTLDAANEEMAILDQSGVVTDEERDRWEYSTVIPLRLVIRTGTCRTRSRAFCSSALARAR